MKFEDIEVMAFVTDTSRCPIMMIAGNKVRSLELTLKEIIGDHLNIITSRHGRRYGWGWGWNENKALPTHVRRVESEFSPSEALPHAKKVKITIEIED
jgi:hypothetical protein